MKKRNSRLHRFMRRWANRRLLRENQRLARQIENLEARLQITSKQYEVDISRLQFENAALNSEIGVMSAVVARELQRVETETLILAKRQQNTRDSQ